MTKERRNISINPETNRYLSQDSVNASALIDRLVTQYRKTNDEETAAMSADKEAELRQQMAVEEAADILLTDRRAEQLTVTNPAVANHAMKAGVSAKRLIELLIDYERDE